MEEFTQGISRAELLKRGAVGAAALAGADALLRSGRAGAAVSSTEARRQARRRHRPVVRGHQRPHRLRIPLGPVDGLRDVRHARQVRQERQGRTAACEELEHAERQDDDREDPQGVKFHNGDPLRVEDVVWSLNRIHDPVKPASNNFLALPKDIWGKAVKVDNQTLRITTKKPARMIESFRFWFIMPENADDLNLGEQPIGTGPFQYKNFVKGDRLDLERFPDYWNGSRPYLNELTFRFLADESAQVANFLSGDVDYLHDISVATLPQVARQAELEADPVRALLPVVAAADVLRPAQGRQGATGAAVGLRQATDNKVAWGGRAVPTWNPFEKSPYSIGKAWPGGGPVPTYDPDGRSRCSRRPGPRT